MAERTQSQNHPMLSDAAIVRINRIRVALCYRAKTVFVEQGDFMDRFLVVDNTHFALEQSSRVGTQQILTHMPGSSLVTCTS